MITREQLKNIPLLNAQIDSKIKQKEECWEMAMCVQSSNLTMERVQSSRHSDPMITVDKVLDMEAEITAEIDRLVDMRREAKKLFKSLPPRDCLLMELRYLEGKKWVDVATAMNHEYRYTLKLHGEILSRLYPDR